MIEVSLDDFLYNYFLINKGVDHVSARDIFGISDRVSEYNSRQNRFDDMVHLNFYSDDFHCVHLDFKLAPNGDGMEKKNKTLTYDDDTIIKYIKLPEIVTDSIRIHTRIKKIKKLRNKKGEN